MVVTDLYIQYLHSKGLYIQYFRITPRLEIGSEMATVIRRHNLKLSYLKNFFKVFLPIDGVMCLIDFLSTDDAIFHSGRIPA